MKTTDWSRSYRRRASWIRGRPRAPRWNLTSTCCLLRTTLSTPLRTKNALLVLWIRRQIVWQILADCRPAKLASISKLNYFNTLFRQAHTFFDSSLCFFLLRTGQGMLSLSKAIKNLLLMLELPFVALRFEFDFAPLNLLNHGSHRRIAVLDKIPLKIR